MTSGNSYACLLFVTRENSSKDTLEVHLWLDVSMGDRGGTLIGRGATNQFLRTPPADLRY